MNASTPTTPSLQRSESSRPAFSSSTDRGRCANDFARMLREKGGDAETDGFGDALPDAPPDRLLASLSPPPSPTHVPLATPAPLNAQPLAPTTPPPSTCGDRVDAIAALQARMDLDASPGAAAPRTFEVSMNERAGVPLALRVVQPADAAGRWSLSIASPHMNQEALRRNTGRLDERLRSRSLSSDPVRIEHDDDDS
jgi:hypothetical protein